MKIYQAPSHVFVVGRSAIDFVWETCPRCVSHPQEPTTEDPSQNCNIFPSDRLMFYEEFSCQNQFLKAVFDKPCGSLESLGAQGTERSDCKKSGICI